MSGFTQHIKRSIKPIGVQCLHRKSPPQFTNTIIIRRCLHHTQKRKTTICSNYVVCKIREIGTYVSPWFILRKLGIPYKYIIRFRRGLRRFSYPWLVYSIPTALAMGIGDVMAQMFASPYTVQVSKDAKGKKVQYLSKKMTLRDVDYKRTAKFMLIGLFIMGPILSKWNIFINRKLSCNTPQVFLAKKVAADILLLSPFLLLLGLALWDFDHVYNSYPNLKPVWEQRLRKPFWEIMRFNLMTRPFVDLVLCLIVPLCLRKFIRRPYEILFFSYVSSVIYKNHLGKKPETPKKCKGKRC